MYFNPEQIDIKKIERCIFEKGLTASEVSRQMGYGRSTLGNNLRSGFSKPVYTSLCLTLGVDFNEFLIKEKQIKKEDSNNENEIIAKIDEMIVAINKLGNIQMQNMEYLKEVLSEIRGMRNERKVK